MGPRQTDRIVAVAFTLLMATAALVACAADEATPSPVPDRPLLTVETRGGLCPEGPCGTTIYLEHDGRVHVAAKPPNDVGVVPADALDELAAAIAATDFDALRSRPFRGTCPTAYDGQELVLTFDTAHGPERIATCETEVDFEAPLFVAVANAVGTFIAIPR